MHCRRVARMACLAMDFRRHFNFSMVFVCWARGESVYAAVTGSFGRTHTCTCWKQRSCTVLHTSHCRQLTAHTNIRTFSAFRILRTPSKSSCWIVNEVRLIMLVCRNRCSKRFRTNAIQRNFLKATTENLGEIHYKVIFTWTHDFRNEIGSLVFKLLEMIPWYASKIRTANVNLSFMWSWT